MKKVYRVRATADFDEDHPNVRFCFFCGRRPRPLNLRELIANHNDNNPDGYTESAVEECFTADELLHVINLLTELQFKDITVEQLPLPYTEKAVGCSALGVGGPTGYLELYKMDGYSLSFEVWAFYDLRLGNYFPSGWLIRNNDDALRPLLSCRTVQDLRDTLTRVCR